MIENGRKIEKILIYLFFVYLGSEKVKEWDK